MSKRSQENIAQENMRENDYSILSPFKRWKADYVESNELSSGNEGGSNEDISSSDKIKHSAAGYEEYSTEKRSVVEIHSSSGSESEIAEIDNALKRRKKLKKLVLKDWNSISEKITNGDMSDYLDLANSEFPGGGNILHVAVKKGDLKAVQAICKRGNVKFNALAVASKGINTKLSALHIAADKCRTNSATLNNRLEVLKTLLDHDDVNINIESSNGFTAIQIAVEWSSHKAVNQFLEKDAELVHYISKEGDDVQDGNFSLLHFAAEEGKLENIKLLVNSGADVSAKTTQGYTPLQYAALAGKVDVVEAMLQYKGATELSGENTTALHSLASCMDYKSIRKIAEMLIADINIDSSVKDNIGGQTALHYACYHSNIILVGALIDNNENNAHEIDNNENNALHFVSMSNSNDKRTVGKIIERLVKKNVNINAQNKSGETPLHTAIKLEKFLVAEILLAYDCDLEKQDQDEKTVFDLTLSGNFRSRKINKLIGNKISKYKSTEKLKNDLQSKDKEFQGEIYGLKVGLKKMIDGADSVDEFIKHLSAKRRLQLNKAEANETEAKDTLVIGKMRDAMSSFIKNSKSKDLQELVGDLKNFQGVVKEVTSDAESFRIEAQNSREEVAKIDRKLKEVDGLLSSIEKKESEYNSFLQENKIRIFDSKNKFTEKHNGQPVECIQGEGEVINFDQEELLESDSELGNTQFIQNSFEFFSTGVYESLEVFVSEDFPEGDVQLSGD